MLHSACYTFFIRLTTCFDFFRNHFYKQNCCHRIHHTLSIIMQNNSLLARIIICLNSDYSRGRSSIVADADSDDPVAVVNFLPTVFDRQEAVSVWFCCFLDWGAEHFGPLLDLPLQLLVLLLDFRQLALQELADGVARNFIIHDMGVVHHCYLKVKQK